MIKNIILKLVKDYKNFVSPLLGKNCRFYPSCSDYMVLAIQKYGTNKGVAKGFLRIFRCHPFSEGGIDLP